MLDLQLGSLPYTVLLYVVSEPGVWTPQEVVEDLPGTAPDELDDALRALVGAGMVHLNSTDGHLWPLKAGKQAFREAGRSVA